MSWFGHRQMLLLTQLLICAFGLNLNLGALSKTSQNGVRMFQARSTSSDHEDDHHIEKRGSLDLLPTPQSTASKKDTSRSLLRNELIAVIERYIGPMSQRGDWKRLLNYISRGCLGDKKLSEKQIEQVLVFLSTQFEIELTRHILQSTPRIFRKNVNTQLEPTLEFLASIYPPDFLKDALWRKPELLLTRGIGYTSDDDLNLTNVFLSQELNLTDAQIQKLQQGGGAFLFQFPIHKLLLTLAYFREILFESYSDATRRNNGTQVEMDDPQILDSLQKLVLKYPSLLGLSLEHNIRPRLNFVKERCNLREEDLGLLLQSSACAVLGLSVKDNLKPTLDYLQNVLQGTNHSSEQTEARASLRDTIMTHPQILGLSLDNLEAKVSFFDNVEGQDHESSSRLASRVLIRAPAVFSLSLTENIVPTISVLAKVWDCDADVRDQAATQKNVSLRDSLSARLGEYPTILTLSLHNNIIPTLSFYNKTGIISLDSEWRSHGIKQKTRLRGRDIAASLYNRLLPRWHFIQEKATLDEKYRQTNVSVHHLAISTDKAFCKHMGFDHTTYQQYKKEAIPRLKFNSQLESWMKSGTPIDL